MTTTTIDDLLCPPLTFGECLVKAFPNKYALSASGVPLIICSSELIKPDQAAIAQWLYSVKIDEDDDEDKDKKAKNKAKVLYSVKIDEDDDEDKDKKAKNKAKVLLKKYLGNHNNYHSSNKFN